MDLNPPPPLDATFRPRFPRLFPSLFTSSSSEIDVTDATAREKMRSAPILTREHFTELWSTAPDDAEAALRYEDNEAD